MFSKTLTETLTIETSDMVYVDEIFFDDFDILYTVETVLKSAIH